MTHFRKLVAIIFREFVAQVLGKQITEVDTDDFIRYSLTLRKTIACNGTRDTVKCIMYILTGKHAKTQDVGDVVAKWINRVLPLTRTIFGGTVLEKQFTLTPNESYPYNIQRNGWKTRTNNSLFDPHEATLRDIDNIYEQFNFPENPLSNREPPKRRREHIDNMQLLSPPRRVRRRGLKQLTDSSQHSSCPIHESVETNGSELIGNHNKADTINVDVDITSSLEPNIEMDRDSDTDHNITISSIFTQEDQESETNYNSNENPIEDNQADLNNSKKDIQVNSIKSLDVPYSLSDPLYNNDSRDFEDDYSEFNNIASPAYSFNISARAPLRSYNDLNSMFEDDNFSLEKELLYNKRKRKFEDLAEQKKVLSKKTDKGIKKQKLNESVETNGSELNGNHNKADTINVDVDKTSSIEPNIEMDSDTDQKFEDLAEQDQKSKKIRKLWRWMKYPFQKKTYRTSINEGKSNISIAENNIVEKENSIESKSAVCENNRNSAKTEEKNTQNSFESDDEI